ncbi:similar to Saccharomyces cerevisiae YGL071W AFT1 Transcription factor involved in iron utilization and homeostasis [Maudiozyma saulgeensis]|uniref:Similar to Saccharomyces cerevisiae YGL071W AFT1 Transcription factor involved in iron utilization and homeostasis n=1 Tax=Maudiozyma saulgeensis TaxID=1789683 RepID=A0A1X7R007_9SACH|nr:similar to Saccharomyces cerevisiae YGL071W AFT1 Transcription factor involved in iron utilization and homeostasis [Kazachstania saulgeensis]
MVTPPFMANIDWNQCDNKSINTSQSLKDPYLHSHSYPQPHTHSHPHDTSHSHSHAFLEYNYNILTTNNNNNNENNTMIQGHAISIEGTLGTVTNPENIHLALLNNKNEDNKLIHLDPVPNFIDKSDIKPWLQKIFYPQGIELVIERSDNTKVVFKCKASKRGKNAKEPMISKDHQEKLSNRNDTSDDDSPDDLINNDSTNKKKNIKKKKKRSVSRFNVCPFRIRATYSLKRKKWGIVVLNNSHSHDLEFNPNSEEYKKFKDKLKSDNDIEAIKKFDELEYRIRVHLPIQNTMIPCDCGMTSEIQSFNIVLPNTTSSTTTSKNNLIHKPQLKKKNTDTLLQQTAKKKFIAVQYNNENKSNSSQNELNKFSNPNSDIKQTNQLPMIPNIPDFIDDQFDQIKNYEPTDNILYTNNASLLPMTLTESQDIMDLNEIDFTNIFTKSFNGSMNVQSTATPTTLENDTSNGMVTNDTNHNGLTRGELELIDHLTPDSSLSMFHNDFTNHTESLLQEPRSRLGSSHTPTMNYSSPHNITRNIGIHSMNDSQMQPTTITTPQNHATVLHKDSPLYLNKELDMLRPTNPHSPSTISRDVFDMEKYQIKNEPQQHTLSDTNIQSHINSNNDSLIKIHESDDQINTWLSSLTQSHSQN